ncbi:DUF1289 domain-containing protein (plasmid) [Ensifer adhaerens]|uniref:DUF1289 domain-containing protein n=1 Tax=Ensifer adhaerens TaxID=106592 RepID=UPI001CBBF39B|nr:DUF1289 domain-containing protein [Ensifer adhaerens]MBZ7927508.1 DUF1289 domain-containing protein [Ensifer adhaerens]UAX97929.1 DUF1289 domain-containing protein [Ensifer adhaerens]UAY05308.1 DUF1289 domain-containing protein [Ensifer adhaerens]UAY12686.1 DUF1289 domain-containing protein [Ensifer adhaerens]
MKIEDPCTDICQFDPRKKWCVGCGRTTAEIKAWRKMSPFHRAALAKELRRRMTRLPGGQ